MICLDKKFSTSRSLVRERPVFENKEEDAFETTIFLSEGHGRTSVGGLRMKGYFKTSYEVMPLVTIITVVYNGEAYLVETIQSVINQTYDNVEYIIIDGGSTDRTLQIIKKHEEWIDYWVSEKDGGIYDAMNKGLALSFGEIIGIINADDQYEPDAIKLSVEAIRDSGADYSIANTRKVPSKIIVKPTLPLIRKKVYQEMMYPHPSTFISCIVYKTVGLFDTRYRIAADFEMAIKIHLHDFNSVYINRVLTSFREGGVSENARSVLERLCIVLSFGKKPISAYITTVEQLLKYYIIRWLPARFVAMILKLSKSRFRYEE